MPGTTSCGIAFSFDTRLAKLLSCKRRWKKVLQPGLNKGPWTSEEDDIVKSAVGHAQVLGMVSYGLHGNERHSNEHGWIYFVILSRSRTGPIPFAHSSSDTL